MDQLGQTGIFLISDTYLCPATGPLLSLAKQIHPRPLFIAISGHYAHYKVLFKKFALNPVYLEISVGWELESFPLSESPPLTWQDASDCTTLDRLPEKLLRYSSRTTCVVLESLFDILQLSDIDYCLKLISSLKSLYPAVVLRLPEFLKDSYPLLEELGDYTMEFKELESGVSSDFTGKVRISSTIAGVRQETSNCWYSLKENKISN